MTRKQPRTSTAARTRMAAAARDPLPDWPTEVTIEGVSPADHDQLAQIWMKIIVERPPNEWSGVDLSRAAHLALLLLAAGRETSSLLSEGVLATKEGRGGREITASNPRLDALARLHGIIQQTARALGLTAATPAATGQAGTVQAQNRQFAQDHGRKRLSIAPEETGPIDIDALLERDSE